AARPGATRLRLGPGGDREDPTSAEEPFYAGTRKDQPLGSDVPRPADDGRIGRAALREEPTIDGVRALPIYRVDLPGGRATALPGRGCGTDGRGDPGKACRGRL